MKVKFVKISDLRPAEYNPRQASKKEKDEVQASLNEFGFVDPVIVNSNPERMNVIIGGHLRTVVWSEMGNNTVPVFYLNLDRYWILVAEPVELLTKS